MPERLDAKPTPSRTPTSFPSTRALQRTERPPRTSKNPVIPAHAGASADGTSTQNQQSTPTPSPSRSVRGRTHFSLPFRRGDTEGFRRGCPNPTPSIPSPAEEDQGEEEPGTTGAHQPNHQKPVGQEQTPLSWDERGASAASGVCPGRRGARPPNHHIQFNNHARSPKRSLRGANQGFRNGLSFRG